MIDEKKNRTWKGIAGVTLLFLVSSATPASPAGSLPVEAALERMADAYGALESLGAELQQIKSYPQLGLTDPAEVGTLHLKRSGKGIQVRLEIREPERRIVTVSGDGRYMLYQPKIKQAIEGRVDQKGGGGSGTSFISYFFGDLTAAKKDYQIVSLGEEMIDSQHTIHLRLTARPGEKGYYPQIDLWVDQGLWMPVQQEFVEPNRSVTRIRFESIRVNDPIQDGVFTIQLPPDVERVRG